LGFTLVHGLLFLGLKTQGDIRARARRWATRAMLPAAVPFLIWFALSITHRVWLVIPVLIGLAALVAAFVAVRAAAELRAFDRHGTQPVAGFAAAVAGTCPYVLPSSLEPACSLTIASASSSDYTLTVMLIVTVIALPVIIAYQACSYR